MIKLYLNLLFLTFIFVSSCGVKKEPANLKIETNKSHWVLPVAYDTLSLRDMLVGQKNLPSSVAADKDGKLIFTYSDTNEFMATNYIKIPAQNLKMKDFNVPDNQVASVLSGNPYSNVITDKLTLNLEHGALFDKVVFKNGDLVINVNSGINHSVVANVTIPQLSNANGSFKKLIPLNPSASSFKETINLAGYELNMPTANELDVNINYTVNLIQGNSLSSSDKVTSNVEIINSNYSYIEGYLGNFDFNFPQDTLFIEIFKNAVAGNIYFSDPKLRINIENSMGAEIGLDLKDKIKLVSNSKGSAMLINGGIEQTITIKAPSISQVGEIITTSLEIDKTKVPTNILTIFNPAPDQVILNPKMYLNPTGKKSKNFVTDKSKFKVIAFAEIPMEGRTSDITIQKTEDFKIDSLDFADNEKHLDYAKLILASLNKFPMDVIYQTYFLDANNKILDSATIDNAVVFKSAVINSEGRAIAPTKAIYETPIDIVKYRRIMTTKKVVMKGKINTKYLTNGQLADIRIYSDYFLAIRFALEVKFKYNPN